MLATSSRSGATGTSGSLPARRSPTSRKDKIPQPRAWEDPRGNERSRRKTVASRGAEEPTDLNRSAARRPRGVLGLGTKESERENSTEALFTLKNYDELVEMILEVLVLNPFSSRALVLIILFG